MLDQNLIDKIDVYLKPNYVEIVEGMCQLTEEEDSGKTRLNVNLSETNSYLCIRDNDHTPKDPAKRTEENNRRFEENFQKLIETSGV